MPKIMEYDTWATCETRIRFDGKAKDYFRLWDGKQHKFYDKYIGKNGEDLTADYNSTTGTFNRNISSVYETHCLFAVQRDVNDELTVARHKEKVVGLTGLYIDLDVKSEAHKADDAMDRKELESIISSDKFKEEVKFTKIVNTGNGYQIHFVCGIQLFDPKTRAEEAAEWQDRLNALVLCLKSYGLTPDSNATKIMQLFRAAKTFNCKGMKSDTDFAARLECKNVLVSKIPKDVVNEWLESLIMKYPVELTVKSKIDKKVKLKKSVDKYNVDQFEIQKMLNTIDPIPMDYKDWLTVGQCLHNWDEDTGLKLWDEWCKIDAERYTSPSEIELKWNSFGSERGLTVATLILMAKKLGYKPLPISKGGKPYINIPLRDGGEGEYFSSTASQTAEVLSKDKHFFINDFGELIKITSEDGTITKSAIIDPVGFKSLIETKATIIKAMEEENVETTFSDEMAKTVLASVDSFQSKLPCIRHIVPCPIITVRDGMAVPLCNYDPVSQTWYENKNMTLLDDIQEAVNNILDIIKDFQFSTPADKSRAIAAILSPMMCWGNLIGGRTPAQIFEADESQAGKGYLCSVIGKIYNSNVYIAASPETKNGLGNIDELLSAAMVNAVHPIIQLDNLRGKASSQKLESFLTEDSYVARSAYEKARSYQTSKYIVLITSNKCEVNPDLANRMSLISIKKRKDNKPWSTWDVPVTDMSSTGKAELKEYVRFCNSKILSSIATIVCHWLTNGRKRIDTPINSAFSKWFEIMGWITSNFFNLPPVHEGMLNIIARVQDSEMTMMRDIAIRGFSENEDLSELRTARIIDLANEYHVAPEQYICDINNDEEVIALSGHLGRSLGRIFRQSNLIQFDNFSMLRSEIVKEDSKKAYVYTLSIDTTTTYNQKMEDFGPASKAIPQATASNCNPLGNLIQNNPLGGPDGLFLNDFSRKSKVLAVACGKHLLTTDKTMENELDSLLIPENGIEFEVDFPVVKDESKVDTTDKKPAMEPAPAPAPAPASSMEPSTAPAMEPESELKKSTMESKGANDDPFANFDFQAPEEDWEHRKYVKVAPVEVKNVIVHRNYSNEQYKGSHAYLYSKSFSSGIPHPKPSLPEIRIKHSNGHV